MPTVRKKINSKAVNRMVTLPAWLDAKVKEQKAFNLSRLVQETLIKVLDVKKPDSFDL